MGELFGREAERRHLHSLWNAHVRLITLHGPIGVGKSALLDQFSNEIPSVVRVNLWLARTEGDILRLVARALNREEADETWIVETLATRSAVLAFDAAEHVRDAISLIVSRWLDQIEALRVLIATREALNIAEESLCALAPLPIDAGAALFVAEMQTRDALTARDRSRISSIVEQLEGLPLSIVFAARRTSLLSIDELAQRLNDPLRVLKDSNDEIPLPYPSLRKAIAWSWDHLSEDECEMLRCASVAPFGFRFGALEKMLGDTERALDTLEALLRKHLLHASDAGEARRFHCRNIVRAFVRETMNATSLAAYERQFSEATVRASECIDDASARDALLFIGEHYASSDPELAARALLSAHATALHRGPFDAYAKLLRNVGASLDARSTLNRAKIDYALGELLRERGDRESAQANFRAAIAATEGARDFEAKIVWADATRLLSVISRMEGDFTLARSLNERALEAYNEISDPLRIATALNDRGAIELASGALKKARESHLNAVSVHRRENNRRGLATALSYLGVATHRLGRLDEALSIHEEAKSIHDELGHARLLAAEGSHIGYTLHERGDLSSAALSFEQAIHHARAAHDSLLLTVALLYASRVDIEQGAFPSATEKLESALAGAEEMKHPRLEATALAQLGHIALLQADVKSAHHLYSQSIARSESSEVGFEHLTHGYLAYTNRLLGNSEAAAKRIKRCIALTANHESPPIGEAARLLESLVNGETAPKSRAASSEVRRILSLFDSSGDARDVRMEVGGAAIQIGNNVYDMKRKGAMRRIFVALVEHHAERRSTALTWQQLAEAGWPGEKMKTEAAIKRVYTAIWALRKMGLGERLVTRDDGYFLSEELKLRVFNKI